MRGHRSSFSPMQHSEGTVWQKTLFGWPSRPLLRVSFAVVAAACQVFDDTASTDSEADDKAEVAARTESRVQWKMRAEKAATGGTRLAVRTEETIGWVQQIAKDADGSWSSEQNDVSNQVHSSWHARWRVKPQQLLTGSTAVTSDYCQMKRLEGCASCSTQQKRWATCPALRVR